MEGFNKHVHTRKMIFIVHKKGYIKYFSAMLINGFQEHMYGIIHPIPSFLFHCKEKEGKVNRSFFQKRKNTWYTKEKAKKKGMDEMNFGLESHSFAELASNNQQLLFRDINENASELVIQKNDQLRGHLLIKKIDVEIRLTLGDKSVSEQERISTSEIAHQVKRILEEKSKERLSILTGLTHVTMDEYLIKDFSAYQHRCSPQHIAALKNQIPELKKAIQNTKSGTTAFSSWVEGSGHRKWHLIGDDGYIVAKLLENERILTIRKRETIRTYINVMSGISFVKDQLVQKTLIDTFKTWGYETAIK